MNRLCQTKDELMIENRKINIILDADGNRLVLINDIVFKGKRNINWDEVKTYLEQYVGDYYEIEESSEKVYIGNKLPDEYTGSESKKLLMGANAKAKANAATAIPELIQIAKNPSYQENRKENMIKMLNLDGIDMMCDLQFLFMRTMCWSDIMFLEQDYLLIMLKTEKNIYMIF